MSPSHQEDKEEHQCLSSHKVFNLCQSVPALVGPEAGYFSAGTSVALLSVAL